MTAVIQLNLDSIERLPTPEQTQVALDAAQQELDAHDKTMQNKHIEYDSADRDLQALHNQGQGDSPEAEILYERCSRLEKEFKYESGRRAVLVQAVSLAECWNYAATRTIEASTKARDYSQQYQAVVAERQQLEKRLQEVIPQERHLKERSVTWGHEARNTADYFRARGLADSQINKLSELVRKQIESEK